MELTILMPCLNEEKTIGACIEEAKHFLDAWEKKESACDGMVQESNDEIHAFQSCVDQAENQETQMENAVTMAPAFSIGNGNAEILVVDNGSSDASARIAEAAGARVVFCKDKGYGNALRYGIQQAKGKYIIMGDCDMSYDFGESGRILEKLQEGADLVMGDRFASTNLNNLSGENAQSGMAGIQDGAMSFSHRYIGVPVLSWLGRIRYRCDVHDFHCGLRGFRRDAFLKLNLHGSGMEFATEMIGKAALAGYQIEQVPVTLRRDGRGAPSHLRSIRDGIRHLRMIFFDR